MSARATAESMINTVKVQDTDQVSYDMYVHLLRLAHWGGGIGGNFTNFEWTNIYDYTSTVNAFGCDYAIVKEPFYRNLCHSKLVSCALFLHFDSKQVHKTIL